MLVDWEAGLVAPGRCLGFPGMLYWLPRLLGWFPFVAVLVVILVSPGWWLDFLGRCNWVAILPAVIHHHVVVSFLNYLLVGLVAVFFPGLDTNERLFYKLLIDNIEQLLHVVKQQLVKLVRNMR
ncbi:hypothetical protein IEQ34_022312 [Dendrobium chrysotoxum]|uniref:Uncharacterized protein n=1 Tax=Dendrobium chrysotoxum TaxID=161865 RepID=A0AAV7FXC6_DENCH|nr:hypothetical protein IEQ34_022312 [Dendrobium chrysotoxum]